ncbi:MAG: AraC family ligand binding domain-containing protein, partial [Pseudomonadota bacterium]
MAAERSANRYHHVRWLPGIEVFEAQLTNQTFARHAHQGFAIGAIATGVGGYVCRGETMVLPPGTLSLMNPEEAHTGQAHTAALAYTMLYATEDAVRTSLDLRRLQGFREVMPRDDGFEISRRLGRLASLLNAPSVGDWRLAVEETVQDLLATVFTVHGRSEVRDPGQEPAAVARVREAIDAAVTQADDLSLSGLAQTAGLHPVYLTRCFKRAVGLSPHA